MLRWPPPAILLQRRARYDCKVVTELPALRALLYTLLVGVVRAVKVTKGAANRSTTAVPSTATRETRVTGSARAVLRTACVA